jgi:anti-anti-sigma regulatory factor
MWRDDVFLKICGKEFGVVTFSGVSGNNQSFSFRSNVMQSTTQSLVVRTLPNSHSVVVTPQNPSYGSLEESKLAALREDLARADGELLAAGAVIVDLSGVERFGSEFLRIVLNQASTLRDAGIPVVICGDQTGLVKLIRADQWISVVPDLCAALNRVAGVSVVESRSSQMRLVVA